MATPFTLGAPIPDILWCSLQESLQGSMRALAKDIAKTLGQPDAPLLAAIKAHTISPYIIDCASDASKEVDMTCRFLCQKAGAPHLCQPCGQPVLWSAAMSHRCAEHAYSPVKSYGNLPVLRPLEIGGEDVQEPLYVSDDNTVYNAEYTAVGAYNRDTGHVFLFEEE